MGMALYNDTVDYANKAANYIIEEFESYGLDFDFECLIKIDFSDVNEKVFFINLYAHELPEDVTHKDDDVLIMFIKDTLKEFISNNNKIWEEYTQPEIWFATVSIFDKPTTFMTDGNFKGYHGHQGRPPIRIPIGMLTVNNVLTEFRVALTFKEE